MSLPDGVLLVDKPAGLTSHDVVARARRLLGTRKVGHAGTLDPMATGLLVLGAGRATRLLTFVVGNDKEYAATIRLGQSTVTDDAEGEILEAPGAVAGELGDARLEDALSALRGTIQQVPAAVSAVRIDGRRAYARVRAGEQVEIAPREVTIHRLELVDRRAGVAADGSPVVDMDVAVECSSGTYVRAIARDLGAALGTGGHLTALRRTRVGPFDVGAAATLAELDERAAAGERLLTDPGDACRALFPVLELEPGPAGDLRHGRPVPMAPGPGIWAAAGPGGGVIGLVENRDGQARALLVLEPA